jgi:hypothetical protein
MKIGVLLAKWFLGKPSSSWVRIDNQLVSQMGSVTGAAAMENLDYLQAARYEVVAASYSGSEGTSFMPTEVWSTSLAPEPMPQSPVRQFEGGKSILQYVDRTWHEI